MFFLWRQSIKSCSQLHFGRNNNLKVLYIKWIEVFCKHCTEKQISKQCTVQAEVSTTREREI